VEGTNKAQENGEAMGFVGVRLTARLGAGLNYIFRLAATMKLIVHSELRGYCIFAPRGVLQEVLT
jgi:hypothetical protein